MATVTTTSVVQITVFDEQGRLKSFNIDNPKPNLTLNQIQNALQPAFIGRWWLSSQGNVIVGLEKATYSTSEKIPIGGETVVITPSQFSITLNRGGSQTDQSVTRFGMSTVTISGANINFIASKLSNITVESFQENNFSIDTSITDENLTLSVYLHVATPSSFEGATGSATLQLNTSVGNLSIPVSITIPA